MSRLLVKYQILKHQVSLRDFKMLVVMGQHPHCTMTTTASMGNAVLIFILTVLIFFKFIYFTIIISSYQLS